MMRRVRSTLSDSDNIAISVQVQLELDLPTGTELGNNRINKLGLSSAKLGRTVFG